MAARKSISRAEKRNYDTSGERCRDCTMSYDWHDKALDGHLIFCRCDVDEQSKCGKFSKFLSDPACEKFQPKPKNNEQVR